MRESTFIKQLPAMTPNILTSFNIILPIIILFNVDNLGMVLLVYIICRAIDVIDGHLARRLHAETKAGIVLDHIADYFLFVIMSYIMWPIICVSVWHITLFIILISFHFGFFFANMVRHGMTENSHTVLKQISCIFNFVATIICLVTWEIPILLAIVAVVISLFASIIGNKSGRRN